MTVVNEVESIKEISQMRAIMTSTEWGEELAVRIITDYLKEEKNIEIKNVRHLTQGEDPPDFYFEIGDHKIGCEIRHFDATNQLAQEEGDTYKTIKNIQQGLQEKGIPPLAFSVHFIKPPKGKKKAEKIVNIITKMYNESTKSSQIYERKNPETYYRLFIENDISSIEISDRDPPDGANIDEKYPYMYNISTRPYKTIKAEEMQAVIDKKDKDIRKYKDHCDQKWLIITNYETIGFFALKGAAKETQYKCNFDKVLYIQMSYINPKISKQKGSGPLTALYAVCELKRLTQ